MSTFSQERDGNPERKHRWEWPRMWNAEVKSASLSEFFQTCSDFFFVFFLYSLTLWRKALRCLPLSIHSLLDSTLSLLSGEDVCGLTPPRKKESTWDSLIQLSPEDSCTERHILKQLRVTLWCPLWVTNGTVSAAWFMGFSSFFTSSLLSGQSLVWYRSVRFCYRKWFKKKPSEVENEKKKNICFFLGSNSVLLIPI